MRDPHLLPVFIFGTLIILASTVTVIISLVIQKERQVKERLSRQQMEFAYSESLMRSRLEVQEHTLNTLAGELHDHIAQSLTGCLMALGAIPSGAAAENGGPILEDVKVHLRDTIGNVRLLSHSLSAGLVEQRDLEEVIRTELARIETFSAIRCALRSETIAEPNGEQKLLLYRIIQEALQNIIKHAQASHISIALDSLDDAFICVIKDDGIGFDAASADHSGSLGLINMKDRVRMMDGTMSIDSARGSGTAIDIRIPLKPTAHGKDPDRNS